MGYYPPQWQPAPPPVPQWRPRNGAGVASMVLGCIACMMAVAFFPLGFVLCVIGLPLGTDGQHRARRGEATNLGTATAGIWLNLAALIISPVMFVVFVVADVI